MGCKHGFGWAEHEGSLRNVGRFLGTSLAAMLAACLCVTMCLAGAFAGTRPAFAEGVNATSDRKLGVLLDAPCFNNDNALSAAMSPDGDTIYLFATDGMICKVNADDLTVEQTAQAQVPASSWYNLEQSAVSPDGEYVAVRIGYSILLVNTSDLSSRIIDASGRYVFTNEGRTLMTIDGKTDPQAHGGTVSIDVWNTSDGSQVSRTPVTGLPGFPWVQCISPDEKMIYAYVDGETSSQRHVYAIDAATGAATDMNITEAGGDPGIVQGALVYAASVRHLPTYVVESRPSDEQSGAAATGSATGSATDGATDSAAVTNAAATANVAKNAASGLSTDISGASHAEPVSRESSNSSDSPDGGSSQSPSTSATQDATAMGDVWAIDTNARTVQKVRSYETDAANPGDMVVMSADSSLCLLAEKDGRKFVSTSDWKTTGSVPGKDPIFVDLSDDGKLAYSASAISSQNVQANDSTDDAKNQGTTMTMTTTDTATGESVSQSVDASAWEDNRHYVEGDFSPQVMWAHLSADGTWCYAMYFSRIPANDGQTGASGLLKIPVLDAAGLQAALQSEHESAADGGGDAATAVTDPRQDAARRRGVIAGVAAIAVVALAVVVAVVATKRRRAKAGVAAGGEATVPADGVAGRAVSDAAVAEPAAVPAAAPDGAVAPSESESRQVDTDQGPSKESL